VAGAFGCAAVKSVAPTLKTQAIAAVLTLNGDGDGDVVMLAVAVAGAERTDERIQSPIFLGRVCGCFLNR
jgi:hypothetical protein